jgi:hypothetical protein
VLQLTTIFTCLKAVVPDGPLGSLTDVTLAVTVYVKPLRTIVQVDPEDELASPGIAWSWPTIVALEIWE